MQDGILFRYKSVVYKLLPKSGRNLVSSILVRDQN